MGKVANLSNALLHVGLGKLWLLSCLFVLAFMMLIETAAAEVSKQPSQYCSQVTENAFVIEAREATSSAIERYNSQVFHCPRDLAWAFVNVWNLCLQNNSFKRLDPPSRESLSQKNIWRILDMRLDGLQTSGASSKDLLGFSQCLGSTLGLVLLESYEQSLELEERLENQYSWKSVIKISKERLADVVYVKEKARSKLKKGRDLEQALSPRNFTNSKASRFDRILGKMRADFFDTSVSFPSRAAFMKGFIQQKRFGLQDELGFSRSALEDLAGSYNCFLSQKNGESSLRDYEEKISLRRKSLEEQVCYAEAKLTELWNFKKEIESQGVENEGQTKKQSKGVEREKRARLAIQDDIVYAEQKKTIPPKFARDSSQGVTQTDEETSLSEKEGRISRRELIDSESSPVARFGKSSSEKALRLESEDEPIFQGQVGEELEDENLSQFCDPKPVEKIASEIDKRISEIQSDSPSLSSHTRKTQVFKLKKLINKSRPAGLPCQPEVEKEIEELRRKVNALLFKK